MYNITSNDTYLFKNMTKMLKIMLKEISGPLINILWVYFLSFFQLSVHNIVIIKYHTIFFVVGLIKFVQDTLLPQLVEKAPFGSDLDIRVISGDKNY